MKIKKGNHLVDSFYKNDRGGLIINLSHKWTYIGFKQEKNHLLIITENGDIDFVFAGEVEKLKFIHQEKDQVVFSVLVCS